MALAFAALFTFLLTAPAAAQTPQVSREALMEDVRILAADGFQGRRTGTDGGLQAQAYVDRRFRELGLQPIGPTYSHVFSFTPRSGGAAVSGANMLALIKGRAGTADGPVLVVSAHFDHIGVIKGEVHNGADDNASGTAALLALAAHFKAHPPQHDMIVAAWDAEEQGLQGARAFMRAPPVPLERVAANLNMDMVGRNVRGELYMAGASHTPLLRTVLAPVAAASTLRVRFGHDTPDLGKDDWTGQSDHGAFYRLGIPFLYLGEEDHPDYHKATDDVERIQPAFLEGATRTAIAAAEAMDAALPQLLAARRPPLPPLSETPK